MAYAKSSLYFNFVRSISALHTILKNVDNIIGALQMAGASHAYFQICHGLTSHTLYLHYITNKLKINMVVK